MKERLKTLKRHVSRTVLAALACALVAVGFVRVDVLGTNRAPDWSRCGDGDSYDAPGWLGAGKGAKTLPGVCCYRRCFLRCGWPVPFGEREAVKAYPADRETYEGGESPEIIGKVLSLSRGPYWQASLGWLAADALLSVLLIAATGVVVWRAARKRWRRLQFSIADMLSLLATVSMVLGLICFDDRLSIGEESAAEGTFVRLRDLPLFDRAAILIAIGCAVWLVVSTVAARLGRRGDESRFEPQA